MFTGSFSSPFHVCLQLISPSLYSDVISQCSTEPETAGWSEKVTVWSGRLQWSAIGRYTWKKIEMSCQSEKSENGEDLAATLSETSKGLNWVRFNLNNSLKDCHSQTMVFGLCLLRSIFRPQVWWLATERKMPKIASQRKDCEGWKR